MVEHLSRRAAGSIPALGAKLKLFLTDLPRCKYKFKLISTYTEVNIEL